MDNKMLDALLRRAKSMQFSGKLLAIINVDMDYLAEAMRWEIELHRRTSFNNFTIQAFVHPVTAKHPKRKRPRPISNTIGTFVGWDKYVFDIWGKPEREVKVRVHWGRGVQVLHLDMWTTIADYVGLLEPQLDRDTTLATPAGRYNHQWNWWQVNGKKFRLLELPAEVRELIYSFALGDRLEPHPGSKARRRGQHTEVIIQRNPNAGLLQVKHSQLYNEASHILFTHATVFVEHYDVLRIMTRKGPLCDRIRRLELSLSHHDYFELFGFNFGDELVYPTSRSARALRQLSLTRLVLFLAPPSLTTETRRTDGACQQTVVDWILEAAWTWVRGHPVTVTGYVKSKQKVAFEATCSTERKSFELWQRQRLAVGLTEGTLEEYDEWQDDEDGGVRLDGSVEGTGGKSVRDDGPMELPPICRCLVPCTVKEWNADA
ncbi:hypothetical protein LTR85_002841 [Meristemomyces frigidus]|nr:hypothetical protein LTR85_002841 [Meristemomyces frigidus]